MRSLSRWSLLLLVSVPLLAATPASSDRPYRLDLELDAAAPFPFLSKFGTVEVSLFPEGVSAKTLVLRGFSRKGTNAVTLMNPLARLYAEIPLAKFGALLLTLSGSDEEVTPGLPEFPVSGPAPGRVSGLDGLRYRIHLGPESSIDVWTTNAIPPNEQYLRIAVAVTETISRPAADIARRLEGTPVYIELNTEHYSKFPLMRVKRFVRSADRQEEELRVGRMYLKVPGSDAILRP